MDDRVQNKIDLTLEQEKAFKSFVRAVKKCQKANVVFYQVLETITGLNGNNIESIHDGLGGISDRGKPLDYAHDLADNDNPFIRVCDGWCDDTHFVELTDEAEKCVD